MLEVPLPVDRLDSHLGVLPDPLGTLVRPETGVVVDRVVGEVRCDEIRVTGVERVVVGADVIEVAHGLLEPVAAPDHLEHDLVGAGADAVEAGVAVGALDLVLLHVAVAAVDLDAVVGDFLDHA